MTKQEQIKKLEAEMQKLETLKQQTKAKLQLQQAKLKARNDKARTRGLIVLGGWVLKNYPHVLSEALEREPLQNKKDSLQFLKNSECQI